MCLTVISFTVRPPTGSGALNPGRSIMTKHARVFTLSPKKKIGSLPEVELQPFYGIARPAGSYIKKAAIPT